MVTQKQGTYSGKLPDEETDTKQWKREAQWDGEGWSGGSQGRECGFLQLK